MSSRRMVAKLIDIGANLTDPMFRGIYHGSQKHRDDLQDVLRRSREGGVDIMIVTGSSLNDSKNALQLAQENDNLYSTAGCHPCCCSEFESHPEGPDNYLKGLIELASSHPSKIVAFGEMGLDYDRLHYCPAQTQREFFEKQLQSASSLKLPLFLHNRNSIDDFMAILKRNEHLYGSYKGVVHSFDGTVDDMDRILEMGFHIGINGCSMKTEDNLEVIKKIPTERLMIETDCPWCEIRQSHASHKYVKSFSEKSKNASNPNVPVKNRNEPTNLKQVLEVVAAVRERDPEELATELYDNTTKLFFNR